MKKNIKIHSIKYNFIMNIILKISGFIFPLITFPYVSRVLQAEANGKIAFASSIVSYFMLIASLGIPSYGIRKCAEVRDDRKELSRVVQELLILNIICAIVTYVAFIIILLSVPRIKSESLLFLITSLSIPFNIFGVEWLYQAIEQYNYITIRNITFKIIAIILMFIFVRDIQDYIIYAGINVFASVGSNILNILKLHEYVDLSVNENDAFRHDTKVKRVYQLKQHIKPILTLFLYNATTTIFTNMDQMMLGFMTGNESVGFYSAAIKIKNILVSVITALGAVMLPRVSYYLKQNLYDKFEGLILKSFEFIMVAAIPIATFFILKADSILIFIAGDKYRDSIKIMQYLMPSIVFIGFSSVTAWQMLIPLKKEKYTVIGAVGGAFIDMLINILLIPKYGAIGAAIGTVIAEAVVLLVHVIVLRNLIKKTFEIKELFKVIIGDITAISCFVIFYHFISINNAFMDCVISGTMFFIIYGLILCFLKEKIVLEIVKKSIDYISKKTNIKTRK